MCQEIYTLVSKKPKVPKKVHVVVKKTINLAKEHKCQEKKSHTRSFEISLMVRLEQPIFMSHYVAKCLPMKDKKKSIWSRKKHKCQEKKVILDFLKSSQTVAKKTNVHQKSNFLHHFFNAIQKTEICFFGSIFVFLEYY